LLGWAAPGLTLIEVIASIALLASVLVGIVVAKSRHTHQLAQALRKQEAVRAADELIASWWLTQDGVPVGNEGVVVGDERLHWRTQQLTGHELEKWGVRVVRVEFHDAAAQSTADLAGETLVTVDLVVPPRSHLPAIVTSKSGEGGAP